MQGNHVSGWACDHARPAKRLRLEVYSASALIGSIRANRYRKDLRDVGIGDGHYGFDFDLPRAGIAEETVAVKVAGTDFWLVNKALQTATAVEHSANTGLPLLRPGISSHVVDDIDVEVAAQLQNLWQKASPDSGSDAFTGRTTIWDGIVASRHQSLLALLYGSDPRALAAYLVALNRSAASEGITQGERAYRDFLFASPSGQRAAVAPFHMMLASFAQSIGVERVECDEQDFAGEALAQRSEELVERIERSLGHGIVPPAIFDGLFGLQIGDRILHGRDVQALYAAVRVIEASGMPLPRVCEIGGGLAQVAYFAWLRGVRRYTIIDLPSVSAMQYFYLRRALPHVPVRFRHASDAQDGETGIELRFASQLESAPTLRADIILNCDSFPEMGDRVCGRYFALIPKWAPLLLSINQEASQPFGSRGDRQTVVGMLLPKYEFKRLYRFRHWIRKGYVEELWRAPGGTMHCGTAGASGVVLMTSSNPNAAGLGVPRIEAAVTASSDPDLKLVPASDVVVDDGCMLAASAEPWLRFSSQSKFAGARFIEIVYRSSLFDDPVRPILRFVTPNGIVERILPAPVPGAGVWRGAVPPGTREVVISPVARAGRFDFVIERVRRLGKREMLGPVWQRRPSTLLFVLLRMALGFRADAENAIDWTIAFEPLDNFSTWHAVRLRQLDVDGVDAPRSDWGFGPLFGAVVHGDGADPNALLRTIESFRAQVYPRFQLLVVARTDVIRSLAERIGDPRIVTTADNDGADCVLGKVDLISRLRPGDELVPHALACFAEEAQRAPQAKLFYADELIRDDVGIRPSFKPNWSPLLESEHPYVGRCAFVRVGTLEPPSSLFDENALRRNLRMAWFRFDADAVVHLRRWLMSRSEHEEVTPVEPQIRLPPASIRERPTVSVIVPTRDRADLIGPCIDSVLRRSTHRQFEVVIVDNGSRDREALKILQQASSDKRVRILAHPGPFNFAQLNNDAVRAASGAVLVFLNNDTVVLTDDWLEQLAGHAVDAAAGAIGARLMFPDGRIQHAGVVVGLGQDAGHFGSLVPEDAPSWLDRNHNLHEVSAVTAACMAVERHKFAAVGGFDAVNLPIDLNDIDLCLRLAERNWLARYAPHVRLIHKQSATRGTVMLLPMSVHVKERRYFRARWRAVIRDDPFFHPALSLYSLRLALG
jgi:O-antigen biosynthesis protein